MKIISSGIFPFFIFLSTVSCRMLDYQPQLSDLSSKQIQMMSQAMDLIKKNDFQSAASIYDQLAKEVQGKSVEAMTFFNSGSSYRNAGDCEKSILRYRKMLEKSLRQSSLKSRGLMEISYSYECMGNVKAAFLSLKDIENLLAFLPVEMNQAIYPARLSLAYAWLGKEKKANQYKSQALNGILKLKSRLRSDAEVSQKLSRIFYLMGKSYMSDKKISAEAFFRAFAYHQTYLLQSYFLNHKTWSQKSKKEIESLFNKLHAGYSNSPRKIQKKYQVKIQNSFKENMMIVNQEQSSEFKNFYKKQINRINFLISAKSGK